MLSRLFIKLGKCTIWGFLFVYLLNSVLLGSMMPIVDNRHFEIKRKKTWFNCFSFQFWRPLEGLWEGEACYQEGGQRNCATLLHQVATWLQHGTVWQTDHLLHVFTNFLNSLLVRYTRSILSVFYRSFHFPFPFSFPFCPLVLPLPFSPLTFPFPSSIFPSSPPWFYSPTAWIYLG